MFLVLIHMNLFFSFLHLNFSNNNVFHYEKSKTYNQIFSDILFGIHLLLLYCRHMTNHFQDSLFWIHNMDLSKNSKEFDHKVVLNFKSKGTRKSSFFWAKKFSLFFCTGHCFCMHPRLKSD